MPTTLEYATAPPSRRVRVRRHRDGIAIYFVQPPWRVTTGVIGDFFEGGFEGCLLLLLAPLFIFGGLLLARAGGFGLGSIALVLIGVGVITYAALRAAARGSGPELAVRAGRVTYRETTGDDVLRDCDASAVVAVLPGDERPIIRTRGGNDLLGGYDAMEVPGYRELDADTKRWVAGCLRAAMGLPSAD